MCSVSGTIFYSQVITIIWQYILDVWQLCNADLHLPQQHGDTNILEQQVQELFHQIQSDPILQPVAPTVTIAQLLQQSSAAIQEWVHPQKCMFNSICLWPISKLIFVLKISDSFSSISIIKQFLF